MNKFWLSAALGLAALVALPSIGSAGPGGGGGHGGGGGYGGHSGYGGHGGYGSHYYGGHGGYYGYGIGIGIGFGYPYAYDYPPPLYPVPPAYYYGPPAVERPLLPPAAPVTTNALIEVRVPANAEIWFEGNKTAQTGSSRSFEPPTVPPGQSFTYDVRARWTGADGKVVDLTRQVRFEAGQRITLDFLRN